MGRWLPSLEQVMNPVGRAGRQQDDVTDDNNQCGSGANEWIQESRSSHRDLRPPTDAHLKTGAQLHEPTADGRSYSHSKVRTNPAQ